MNSPPTTGDSEEDIGDGLRGQPSVSLSELLFTATPRTSIGAVARTEELELVAGETGDNVETVAEQADDLGETSTVVSLFASLFPSTDPTDESPRSGRVLFPKTRNTEPPPSKTGSKTGRRSRDERSWSDVFLSNLQGRRTNRRLQRGDKSQTSVNTPLKMSPNRHRGGGVNFKQIKVPANGRWRSRPWG